MLEAPHTQSASLVIDNLLLQQVGETLRVGLTDDQRVEIAASGEHGYEVRPVPSAGVQVEELLQFLNAIILTDELVVDAASTSSWEDVASHFEPATEARLLIKKPFSDVRSEWLPLRKLAEEALSFSPQLSADFAEFRANWKPGVNDPVFSTLMEAKKRACRNYALSGEISLMAYALHLANLRCGPDVSRVQRFEQNHPNLFGDAEIIQEALFLGVSVLSNDQTDVGRMAALLGIPFRSARERI